MGHCGDGGRAPDGSLLEPAGGIGSGGPLISPREILEDRAQLSDSPIDRQRKMLCRFDAWTDPRIAQFLNCEGNTLSDIARKLFYDERPPIEVDVLTCAFVL